MKRNSEHNAAYRERNPEKVRAHWMVQEALKQKRLFREPCEKCGNLKVHAHHDDYSKPLAVRWLCQKCHVLEHHPKELRKPQKHRPYVYRYYDRRKPKELWSRHPNIKRPELEEQAKEMRTTEATYREIGIALGVSKSTVFKWLNQVEYQ